MRCILIILLWFLRCASGEQFSPHHEVADFDCNAGDRPGNGIHDRQDEKVMMRRKDRRHIDQPKHTGSEDDENRGCHTDPHTAQTARWDLIRSGADLPGGNDHHTDHGIGNNLLIRREDLDQRTAADPEYK